jgi:branched-chain amino acid transport system permease protein
VSFAVDRIGESSPSIDSDTTATGIVVEVEGLTKRFGGLDAVQDVTFELRERTITALIGPNGAGKTTLFNLMAGRIRPDRGRVLLFGRDVAGLRTDKIARLGMARSFQDVRGFAQLSAIENVALAVPNQFGEKVRQIVAWPVVRRSDRRTLATSRQLLDYVGVTGIDDRPVRELSFADQKLVAIARVLATGAKVLLLDEPTAGVDSATVDRVIELLWRLPAEGFSICVIEHSIHLVENLATDAIFLDQGKIVTRGTISELTSREDLAAVYFGV